MQRCQNLVRQHGIEHGAAFNRARQRPDTVERKRQRHRAIERNPPLCRLEADDAVERCRNTAGAAGVGAERAMRHAVKHRYRRTRRRSARHVTDAALPCAFRRAEMRIDADAGIGELGHVGAADHHKTGAPQPRHHRRVGFRGRGIFQCARAGPGHLAPDVEQVLDRNGDAGIGRRRGVDLAQPVHRFGRLDRGFGVNVQEGPRALAACIGNPCQASIDQRPRRGPPRIEIGGEGSEGWDVAHCQSLRHGRACPGHPRLIHEICKRRGCPAQGRA